MKRTLLTFAVGLAILSQTLSAQQFSVSAYKDFLRDHKDLTSERLYGIYPVGLYKGKAKPQQAPLYLDSISEKLNLTGDEHRLIGRHGFMVSERLSHKSFWKALEDIWHKDLPIFITSDAILHAFHMSYDAILKNIETAMLIPRLSSALSSMHAKLPEIAAQYSSYPAMAKSINDVDVYLTIARKLLEENKINPAFNENALEVNKIMELILAEKAISHPLFSSSAKILDFSQFTVRGHYTQSEELGRYFKSMIWLGRTEFYLIAPKSLDNKQTPEDIQRQIIDAALILEAAESTDALAVLGEINKIIEAMVGESDNVQLLHIREILNETGIGSVVELTNMSNVEKLQNYLKTKPYAEQKILSQILISDDFTSPDKIEPAAAFMLLGQRFVIDSYVFGNVVFDKIYFDGRKICRLLPSSLDVLFALGNNAASDLLKPQLDEYKYGSNLASMRYLIDSYNADFWTSSVYNGWLGAIRSLNPPDDAGRGKLPEFMQTAAWWQQKMNTQLASWAQLRHDNLLYAKQSYTGGTSCSYPYAYIEPVPEFFNACAVLASTAKGKMTSFLSEDGDPMNDWLKRNISDYFDHFKEVSEKLSVIAAKQLRKEAPTSDEIFWLKSIFSEQPNCGPSIPDGWFAKLFFSSTEDAMKQDNVIADVHTAPTDCNGNMTGYVLHVGTGDVNLAVIIADNEDGVQTAYVGPVMSYLEHISLNFKRLTDEEWKDMYNSPAAVRPNFTQLYLADREGRSEYNNPPILPVSDISSVDETNGASAKIFAVPNPFSESTLLSFNISGEKTASVEAWIADINGKRIRTLFAGSAPSGNFSLRWDGSNDVGIKAPKGAYFYYLKIDGVLNTNKIILK